MKSGNNVPISFLFILLYKKYINTNKVIRLELERMYKKNTKNKRSH